MRRKSKAVLQRAVHIAAGLLDAAEMCVLEDRIDCTKLRSEESCEECIEKWLLSKARQELKEEEKK